MSTALPRLGIAAAQVVVVVCAVFALTALLPGDTAEVLLGEHADAGQVAALRQRLGLDEPVGQRFLEWAGGLAHGDLGTSLRTGTPVAGQLAGGLATTLVLALLTAGVVLPLALAIGVRSGLRPGSRFDRVVGFAVVLLDAVPEFALALLLVGVLSVQAGLLPATAVGLSGWELLGDPAVLVLPVAVLVAKHVCALARQVRAGVLAANGAEFARHVRRTGLSRRAVTFRHVLPNAAGPVVQQLARTIEGLLGGVVVVEALFALPGLGSGFVEAVKARDIPAVQGHALVFALTVIAANLIADLVTRRVVPR